MEQLAETEEYSKVTREIRVAVSPRYIPQESEPENSAYAYAYTVTLENTGSETVQLVNRHWIVVSGGRQIADVKGEGVVGEQPVLHPGDKYEYTSWTMVNDTFGEMYGSYTFFSQSGEFFDVEIPKFHLLYLEDGAVH